MTQLRLVARERQHPMIKPLVIARETFVAASTLEVSITDGSFVGRGEGCPALRFGETAAAAVALIAAHERAILAGDRQTLQSILPAGPARNAVDCAFWDLEAKRAGRRAWELAGMETFRRIRTVRTVGLGTPEEMAAEAKRFSATQALKVKADSGDILRRVAAVRAAQPQCEITVDANEAWSGEIYRAVIDDLAALGVSMIEQPFPAEDDSALTERGRPIPVYADESCCQTRDIAALKGRYDGIAVKLDKAGGLTEALRMVAEAQRLGLELMIGCNGGTSLGVVPAMIVGQSCRFADLDQAFFLSRDIENGVTADASGLLSEPAPALWG